VDAAARLAGTGGVVTLEFADYVEVLLRSLYPHADILVTPEPDKVSFEVYEASFSLHASIGDERSAVLAVLEQLLLKACLAAS
jgi:hypothetical protein